METFVTLEQPGDESRADPSPLATARDNDGAEPWPLLDDFDPGGTQYFAIPFCNEGFRRVELAFHVPCAEQSVQASRICGPPAPDRPYCPRLINRHRDNAPPHELPVPAVHAQQCSAVEIFAPRRRFAI